MIFREPKDLSRNCGGCGTFHDIVVEEIDYVKWRHGTRIQNAFPYLSLDLRELLISGICGDCYDKMFELSEDEIVE
jgi:hypothetical protein